MQKIKSKLLHLKQWVTVPDAARYLSEIMSESVSEADVLQLALDGQIKLSVDFPNRAKAHIGRILPFREIPRKTALSLNREKEITLFDGYPLHGLMPGECPDDDAPIIHFDKKVTDIAGVWDLAMFGNERIDVEFDLQRLIGGPEVTMVNFDGTFLNLSDGTWAALLEQFEGRTEISDDGRKKTIPGDYYPAGGLGDDCTRVVRTSEILAFQSKLTGADSVKPLSNRERDTLLTIIGLVCDEARLDYTKHAKAASLIKNMADLKGISIGESTIEGHLKKVTDALAGRMN